MVEWYSDMFHEFRVPAKNQRVTQVPAGMTARRQNDIRLSISCPYYKRKVKD